MPEEPEASNGPPDFDFNIDLRPVDTLHAVSALKKYFEVMEQQMQVIQLTEISSLEADRPPGNDDEEQSIFSGYLSHLENLFEEDLVPSMRYSFIVLLHTVFETHLHFHCRMIRQERNLPISLSDLRGSAIDQARDFLTKLARIRVGDYPEWNGLRMFQKIRDCIVHHYGFLKPDNVRHRQIRYFAENDPDIVVTHQRRLSPDANFCVRQHSQVESFFRHLMADMGWDV